MRVADRSRGGASRRNAAGRRAASRRNAAGRRGAARPTAVRRVLDPRPATPPDGVSTRDGRCRPGRLRASLSGANLKPVARLPVAARVDPAMIARDRSGLRPATALAHHAAKALAHRLATALAHRRGRGWIRIPGCGPAQNRAVPPMASGPSADPAADPAAGRRSLDLGRRRSPKPALRLDRSARDWADALVRVRGLGRGHGRGQTPVPARVASRAGGRSRRRACLVDCQSHSYPIILPDASAGRHGCLPREPLVPRVPCEADLSRPNRGPPWPPHAGLEASEAPRSACRRAPA